MSEEKAEWNPSVNCLQCDHKLTAVAHTFPGVKRSRPFFSYKCSNCNDSGTWTSLARMYGIG